MQLFKYKPIIFRGKCLIMLVSHNTTGNKARNFGFLNSLQIRYDTVKRQVQSTGLKDSSDQSFGACGAMFSLQFLLTTLIPGLSRASYPRQQDPSCKGAWFHPPSSTKTCKKKIAPSQWGRGGRWLNGRQPDNWYRNGTNNELDDQHSWDCNSCRRIQAPELYIWLGKGDFHHRPENTSRQERVPEEGATGTLHWLFEKQVESVDWSSSAKAKNQSLQDINNSAPVEEEPGTGEQLEPSLLWPVGEKKI